MDNTDRKILMTTGLWATVCGWSSFVLLIHHRSFLPAAVDKQLHIHSMYTVMLSTLIWILMNYAVLVSINSCSLILEYILVECTFI